MIHSRLMHRPIDQEKPLFPGFSLCAHHVAPGKEHMKDTHDVVKSVEITWWDRLFHRKEVGHCTHKTTFVVTDEAQVFPRRVTEYFHTPEAAAAHFDRVDTAAKAHRKAMQVVEQYKRKVADVAISSLPTLVQMEILDTNYVLGRIDPQLAAPNRHDVGSWIR